MAIRGHVTIYRQVSEAVHLLSGAKSIFFFDVGPELRTDIGEQIESNLGQNPAPALVLRCCEPVRVPLVGSKSRAVSTPQAPGGQRLAAGVGACKNGPAERVTSSGPSLRH